MDIDNTVGGHFTYDDAAKKWVDNNPANFTTGDVLFTDGEWQNQRIP